MDFRLTEEQTLMRDTARQFAMDVIAPLVAKDEETHTFRPELVRQMGEMGFYGCVIPEEYGGTGAGMVASMLVTEQVARVSASYGVTFNMQTQGPALTLLRWGTDAQKEKYIPGLVSADLLGAFAITEPNSGSDVVSMKTTAVRDGDDFILNGSKTWISNAQVADVALVYAMTDRSAKHRGMTAFIVDMKKTPGVTTRAIDSKLGLYLSPTGEIFFEDVRIPAANVLGEVNGGFKVCMTMLDNTRLSCAARGVGVARACLDAAIEYARERTQFGKPIADFQLIRADLAEMFVEEEAARLLVLKAAHEKEVNPNVRNTLSVSTAKFFSAETAVKAANAALKIFGSYGFSTEYPAERLYRDAKSYQIVEGTSNIQKIIIANHLLK
jgi:glutaryl-CoA dehydrogenase (non-decarboxylating)